MLKNLSSAKIRVGILCYMWVQSQFKENKEHPKINVRLLPSSREIIAKLK